MFQNNYVVQADIPSITITKTAAKTNPEVLGLQHTVNESKILFYLPSEYIVIISYFLQSFFCLQCFDTVGWAAEKASGL